jgi:hypothetical protein
LSSALLPLSRGEQSFLGRLGDQAPEVKTSHTPFDLLEEGVTVVGMLHVKPMGMMFY